MPQVQLGKPVTQIATASYTFLPASPAGQNYAASITLIRGISLASSSTQFVPTAEYWYITGFYINTVQAASIANAMIITYVNSTPQPFAPAEGEILMATFNKLTLPPQEWIHLPNGQSWQRALQATATVTTTTTTVTIQETILRVPLTALS